MLMKQVFQGILVLTISLVLAPGLFAESPAGIWKSRDDKTGEFKAHIEIYEANGKLYGKIVKLLLAPEDSVCIKCTGELKDKPVVGMLVLWDLAPDGNEYSGGRTLEVESGKTYKAKIWIEDGTLKVRGFLGPFYRTQTWFRIR